MFQVLVTLVNERPKVLSKLELLQRLWPDAFVAEANLSNIVAESREALGDNRGRQTCVVHACNGLACNVT